MPLEPGLTLVAVRREVNYYLSVTAARLGVTKQELVHRLLVTGLQPIIEADAAADAEAKGWFQRQAADPQIREP